MRFSIVSAFAFVAAVMAQSNQCNANCFSESTAGTIHYNAGDTVPLTWTNKEGNTVTIKLAYGTRNDLTIISTIADNIANTGSFSWTIDPNTPQRVSYALEIINDDNNEINYSSQFDILNPNNIASDSPSSSAAATGSSSTDASASTATDSAASTTATGSAASTTLATSGTSAASSAAATTKPASTTGPSVSVPTPNAGSRPAFGAAGGLLAVAAGFAIAL